MSYVLRCPNPSKIVGGNVYYSEHGRWTADKEKAVKFMKLQSHIEYDAEADELMLPIPDEILDSLGWDIGDVLQWEYNDDSIILKRADV